MSNADIFGYSEELWGERKDNKVLVWKRHFRSAWDAAVPPGQSVGFEFYAAQFPFDIVIAHSGDEVGTTARVAGGAGLRISVETDQPFRSNPISRFGVFDHPAEGGRRAVT